MANNVVLWEKDKLPSSLRPPKSISNFHVTQGTATAPTTVRPEQKSEVTWSLDSELNVHLEAEQLSSPAAAQNPTDARKHLDDIVARSILKADAPEWYPKNSVTNNSVDNVSSSIQNRLKIHRVSSDNDTAYQYNDAVNQYSLPDQNIYEDIENSSDIKRLKQIITTLTKDPGQFDNLLELFMETLFPHFEDIMALSTMAQLLVGQAINNGNFRYTGARLCWYVEQNCPKFRAELHLKCKKQLDDNIDTQNVLLFIAELYTQLPHLNVYGALLIESFRRLLSKGGNDNIKCICQALKLTGFSLEHSNKNDLDDVLKQLQETKKYVSPSVLSLLNSVCNLRSINWGRSSEVISDSDHDSDGMLYDGLQNPVFYHPDGNALTNEESEFIAAHMHANEEFLSDASDPDELCDPEPEMDEEIQEAFKEFIKFSSKH